MSNCCQAKENDLKRLREEQSRVLKIVLVLNAAMFVLEMTAGLFSHSSALKADALDMLGDALVYAFSLYVVAQSLLWKARAALLKGIIMGAFGLGVAIEVLLRLLFPVMPEAPVIGGMGLLALGVNVICLYLLASHKQDDINMTSVWLCSRNDIVANVGIIVASVGVWATHSQWPDVFVGAAIACLFLHSAFGVMQEAWVEMRVQTS